MKKRCKYSLLHLERRPRISQIPHGLNDLKVNKKKGEEYIRASDKEEKKGPKIINKKYMKKNHFILESRYTFNHLKFSLFHLCFIEPHVGLGGRCFSQLSFSLPWRAFVERILWQTRGTFFLLQTLDILTFAH